MVLHKDSQEVRISMRFASQSSVGLRARWIVMAHNLEPFSAPKFNQIIRIESKSLRY
jgi:hypothetical protein